jgi:3-oxoacyl-[acyl-carrier-protein] synthase-3
MRAAVRAIEYYLPKQALTNDDLATLFPDWPAERIEAKTGIVERRVAAADECASDLGVAAAGGFSRMERAGPTRSITSLLCTQSPDYFLPTTACLLQGRLGLRTGIGAIDINQGCSGFVYGLGLAKGLVETGQAERVLLITAETYSKFLHPGDKSVRSLFGDGAAATLISAVSGEGPPLLGPFVYGTDGRGAPNLIVPSGAARLAREPEAAETRDGSGNTRTINHLYMNGPSIFSFTLKVVPEAITQLQGIAGLEAADVQLYVLHQASGYMLDHLRRKLQLPRERFAVALSHCGNTVSSTIPIALQSAHAAGGLHAGDRVIISWASASAIPGQRQS